MADGVVASGPKDRVIATQFDRGSIEKKLESVLKQGTCHGPEKWHANCNWSETNRIQFSGFGSTLKSQNVEEKARRQL